METKQPFCLHHLHHLPQLECLDAVGAVIKEAKSVSVEFQPEIPPIPTSRITPVFVSDLWNHCSEFAPEVSNAAWHVSVFLAPFTPGQLDFSATNGSSRFHFTAFIQKCFHW